jgi:hypothetical protein
MLHYENDSEPLSVGYNGERRLWLSVTKQWYSSRR